jgi:hypothetical protein
MFCFAPQKICQHLIAAGMLLVIFYELLVTQGTGPHKYDLRGTKYEAGRKKVRVSYIGFRTFS